MNTQLQLPVSIKQEHGYPFCISPESFIARGFNPSHFEQEQISTMTLEIMRYRDFRDSLQCRLRDFQSQNGLLSTPAHLQFNGISYEIINKKFLWALANAEFRIPTTECSCGREIDRFIKDLEAGYIRIGLSLRAYFPPCQIGNYKVQPINKVFLKFWIP